MKIANAASIEMEAYIKELIEQILYDLLPRYVSKDEMEYFYNNDLLNVTHCPSHLYNGLLDQALQIISSLQTIIAVIESIEHRNIEKKDYDMFNKNIQILKRYGISFPIDIKYFSKENNLVTHSHETACNYFVN